MDLKGRGNEGCGRGGSGKQDSHCVFGCGRGGGRVGWGAPVVANPYWGAATTPDSLASDLARMEISPSPVQRPHRGPSLATNATLWLCPNNLPLQFDEKMIIYHYDVDIRPATLPMAARTELFRVYAAQFHLQVVAYDGNRSLLTPGPLTEGDFRVAVQGCMLHVALKLLEAVTLQELCMDVKDVMYF